MQRRKEAASAESGEGTRALTKRVLLFALLIIPLNSFWLTQTEFIRYSDNVTTQSLFFNALTLLLLIAGGNRLLRRVRPAWAMSPPETLTLYLILVCASGLAGHDTLQILFTTISYPVQRAGTQADGGERLLASLPPHLVVTDKTALQALYSGHSSLYRPENWQPWLLPLASWTAFVLSLVWTMLCLTTLVRRRWEEERLAFPITEIPLQLIEEERSGLLRRPMLWLGFGIGATLQILNLLHALFPALPGSPSAVHNYRAEVFPWSAAGTIPFCTYAFAYGLTFLLPTQLGFSCWFFFLISRLELVLAAIWGYTETGKFPYVQQQGVGAIFGLFVTLVWSARSHLKAVWSTAFGPRDAPDRLDDRDEPMSYRTALIGAAGGFAFLATFAISAGMRPTTTLLFLGITLIVVIVVARLRAELGLPTFELYQVGADQILPTTAGTRAWTTGDYTTMSLLFFLVRTHRQFPMQTHIDAMHMGAMTRTPLRSLTLAILGASFLAIVTAFWAFLEGTYRVGFESAQFQGPAFRAFGQEPWRKWENWTGYPLPPDPGAINAYGFGALFTLFLAGMRSRFPWWPFHPAGYLVAGSFGLFRLWLPIFVSWLIKVLLLRYGGLPAYRRALPFFFGLVLGEFAAGLLRSLLDVAFSLYLPAQSGIGGL